MKGRYTVLENYDSELTNVAAGDQQTRNLSFSCKKKYVTGSVLITLDVKYLSQYKFINL